ncbi:MAG: hypothetical protein LBK66_11655 [Spirochaetaceae bacterium]|jgi:hypothetical protein|nr:hypothetical protein [Spirochaetaceae bacterium]
MKRCTKLFGIIVIGALITIGVAGCGSVEVGDKALGFMPVFLTNMIAKGFWWAILAGIIFSIPFGILGFILLLRKINSILGCVILGAPYVFFTFYIWHIRGHVIWLIFAICGVLGFIRQLAVSIIKPVKTDTNTPEQGS